MTPWKNLLNLLLLAAFCWLQFGAGAPLSPGPLTVLVVEETADRDKLTEAQREIVGSVVVRDYLKGHCAKDAAGNPEYLFVDKDDDLSQAPANFQSLFREPRTSLPWIYIALGGRTFSGPVDATTLATLHAWGGS